MTHNTDRNERQAAAAPSGSQADLSRQPEEAETTARLDAPATGGGGQTPSTAQPRQAAEVETSPRDSAKVGPTRTDERATPGEGAGSSSASTPLEDFAGASRSPDVEASPDVPAGSETEVRAETRERGDDGPASALTVSGEFDAAADFQQRPDAPAPDMSNPAASSWMVQAMEAMRDRIADMTDNRGDGGGDGRDNNGATVTRGLAERIDDLRDRADDLLGRGSGSIRQEDGDGKSDTGFGAIGDLRIRADDLLGRDEDDGFGALSDRLDGFRGGADDEGSGREAGNASPGGIEGLREQGDALLAGLRGEENEAEPHDRPSLLAQLFDGDLGDGDAEPGNLIGLAGARDEDDEDDKLDLIGDFWVPAFGDGSALPDPFDNPGG